MKKTSMLLLACILAASCLTGSAGETMAPAEIRLAVEQAFMGHAGDPVALTQHTYEIGTALEGYLYGLPVYAEYSVSSAGEVDLFLLFYQTYAASRRSEAIRAFDRALEQNAASLRAVGELTFCLSGEDQAMFEWRFDGSSHSGAWLTQAVEWYFSAVQRVIRSLKKSGDLFKYDPEQNRIAASLKPEAAPTEGPDNQEEFQGLDGEWRWVDVEVDCPSCVNGVCPICHGMGYITMYGQKVNCDKQCSSCGGKGTFTQRQYHFFSPANSSNWLY